jgi:hypothetical protein
MGKPIRILIRLRGGYGLGDCVQFSVILKHLRKYRPDWQVTVKTPRGCQSALYGLCHAVLHDGEPDGEFDKEATLDLEDSYLHFSDRPSNKTVFNLKLLFGLDYDPACGGYEVNVGNEVYCRMLRWYNSIGAAPIGALPPYRAVILHYRGGNSKPRKDLEHWQAEVVLDAIRQAGRTPILWDWHGSLAEIKNKQVITIPDSVWGGFGHGDAETMAAMIRLSEAFIGIDSGPGKVASATACPSLICWHGHHPARYHDPAPRTTHLIPADWRGMSPIEWDADREAFFRANYYHRTYQGEHGLVHQIVEWLREHLHEKIVDSGVSFVIPATIMSAAWAMSKVRNIAGSRPFEIMVSSTADEEAAIKTAAFIHETFPFVTKVKCKNVPVHMGPDLPQNTRGHYLYVSDGLRLPYHFLIPDQMIQTGRGLADWLPDSPIDWDAVKMLPDRVLGEMEERGHLGCRTPA